MRQFILFLFMAFGLIAAAQNDPRLFSPYKGDSVTTLQTGLPGKVVVHETKDITELMKSYAKTKQPLKGYRVQIFLGKRDEAESIRRSFLLKHPEIPAYLSFLAPNFRVRVGDALTKMEAEQLRLELREEFPGGYVVPDDIELPRLMDRR